MDPLLYDHYIEYYKDKSYLENVNNERIELDLFKADIFSLGVALIEAATGKR